MSLYDNGITNCEENQSELQNYPSCRFLSLDIISGLTIPHDTPVVGKIIRQFCFPRVSAFYSFKNGGSLSPIYLLDHSFTKSTMRTILPRFL